MSSGNLTDLHKDMLAEIFNMGMGQAVNAISQLSGKDHEVTFQIPTVEFISKKKLIENLESQKDIGMIVQRYHGSLEGRAIMYYPQISGKELARLLIGTDIPLEKIERLESDAFVEIGNIFINASLSSLAHFIGQEILTDLPQIVFSDLLSDEGNAEDYIIQLNSSFRVDEMEIDGKVAFLLEPDALETLLLAIDNYLASMG